MPRDRKSKWLSLMLAVVAACGTAPPLRPVVAAAAEACPSLPAPLAQVVPTDAPQTTLLLARPISRLSGWGLSPDGRVLAVTDAEGLVLADTTTGLPFRRLTDAGDYDNEVRFGAHAIYLANDDDENTLTRVDLTTGEIATLAAHGSPPVLLGHGVVARIDGSQRVIIEDATAECDPAIAARALARTPDDMLLVSSDDGRRVLDPHDCAVLRTLATSLPAQDAIGLSRDGRTMVLGTADDITLVDAESGQPRCEIHGDHRTVHMTTTGIALALSVYDYSVRAPRTTYYDLATCNVIDDPSVGIADQLTRWTATEAHDGLALGHGDDVVATVGLIEWSARTERFRHARPSPRGDAVFLPRVLSDEGLTTLLSADGLGSVRCAAVSSRWDRTGRYLVTGVDGACDPRSGAARMPAPAPSDSDTHDPLCPSDATASCVWLVGDRAVSLVDARGERVRLDGARSITGALLSPDGAWLAGWTYRSGVRVWSRATGHVAARFPDAELAVVWSPSSQWLALVGPQGAFAATVEGTRRVLSTSSQTREVAFDPTDSTVALCDTQHLRIVGLTTSEEPRTTDVACYAVAAVGPSFVARGHRVLRVIRGDGTFVGSVPIASLHTDEDDDLALDAPTLLRCRGDVLDVIDTATLTTRATYAAGCRDLDEAQLSSDGSLRARLIDHQELELRRQADGATLHVRVMADGLAAYARADDGAFDVVGTLGPADFVVVEETGTWIEPRATRADDPAIVARFHRPTLIADFFSGRPLPRAAP